MPLAARAPQLDDRRYDDLVAEARARIPRYTPEWTDHNDSDPGITLVQLFAWLSDMLLYRLAQVPEQNYLKFLELLGVELAPARPARVEVTFPLLATAPASLIVPARAQLMATVAGSPRPVVFETDRALIALRAPLDTVLTFHDERFDDRTRENAQASEGFEPFGPAAVAGSALYLGLRGADAPPPVELDLAFVVPEAVGASSVTCGGQASQLLASSRLAWEFWDGDAWRPLRVRADTTLAFIRSGHVTLELPAAGRMQPLVLGDMTEPRWWVRARLERAAYERTPVLQWVRTNTVAATQAETIVDEIVGGSDGQPNQLFRLASAPVLEGSLLLEIDDGTGVVAWQEVTDFYGSGPSDAHFVLDRTTGELRFGDGRRGAIPVGNPNLPGASIVARRYRVGGGTLGNLAAGVVTTLVSPITGIDDAGVRNLAPAAGGGDEETLEEARLRVPHALRSRDRAVTTADFEELAKRAANVRRAKALPLAHPEFPGVRVPGAVTVIVVPDSPAMNPLPNEGTLRAVCACLDRVRLLTTEVYVVPPTYQRVRVVTELVANDDADLATIQREAERALTAYFHPLEGGEDGAGWPFGGDIFFSRVYQRASVAGVQRVESLVIELDGEPMPPCTNVAVCANALLHPGEHDVRVRYASDA